MNKIILVAKVFTIISMRNLVSICNPKRLSYLDRRLLFCNGAEIK